MDNRGFIKFLDDYKGKQEMLQTDYLHMLRTIDHNYVNMSYPVPDFSNIGQRDVNVYKKWQEEHVTQTEIEDEDTVVIEKPKTKKIINVILSSFDDLIQMINDNEYDEQYSYNIDLKSLHLIKPELIKLNSMIGMKKMKDSLLDQLLYFLQGLHEGEHGDYKHTIIYGPPGTGKTEVAKIIGMIYSKVGILKKNVFKKVTRCDLVAGFLGQTAIKTKKVLDSCIGGVLFIDEVYALGSSSGNDDFSRECIDTICEALSDYKNDLMVIIAGYKEEIDERFFQVNSGLESRFIWKFNMENYNADELYNIFKNIVSISDWKLDDGVKTDWFTTNHKRFKSLGRDMELLFTFSKISYGRRMYGNENVKDKLISLCDLNKGFDIFKNNKPDKNHEMSNYLLSTIYM
jgi:SpoVK/Ycf46/Vps4 family AAA+-type ATPase